MVATVASHGMGGYHRTADACLTHGEVQLVGRLVV
jgi:hypothetical protein